MERKKHRKILTAALVAALRVIDAKFNVVQIKHLVKWTPTKAK